MPRWIRNEDKIDEIAGDLTKQEGLPLSRGGLLELSVWGGEGAAWTRSELRSGRVAVKPATVEGLWYAVGVVRALAQGRIPTGFNDAAIQRAAKELQAHLDGVLDMYDS